MEEAWEGEEVGEVSAVRERGVGKVVPVLDVTWSVFASWFQSESSVNDVCEVMESKIVVVEPGVDSESPFLGPEYDMLVGNARSCSTRLIREFVLEVLLESSSEHEHE